jgi:ATP-dependent Clp protease adaptor protein ClpS
MIRAASAPGIAPERLDQPTRDAVGEHDRVWNVIVWNDPVTLMSYVVYVLRKLFGYNKPTATRLMLQVHNEGKAVVSTGSREKAEADVYRLHAHGLQATMARD